MDYTGLNEYVCRENLALPSVEQSLGMLAKVFNKLVANMGFWQISLLEESAKLTTFITPFGRFNFNRLPFGINSAPEHFQQTMSEVLEGQEGVVCHIADVWYGDATKRNMTPDSMLLCRDLKKLEFVGEGLEEVVSLRDLSSVPP